MFDGDAADETAKVRSKRIARRANDSVEYDGGIRCGNNYLMMSEDRRAVGQRPRATWVSKVLLKILCPSWCAGRW